MSLLALTDDAMPRLPAAACKDVDPEAFFATEPQRVDRARDICRRCPEIRACLAWALEHRVHGVWAATTEEQRTDLLARHGRTAS